MKRPAAAEEVHVLEPLERLVTRAGRRLRVRRAAREGGRALVWTLAALCVAALILEIGWDLGLRDLLLLLSALVIPLVVALRALLLAPGVVRSAKALDAGATLFDRIGTALALAGLSGGLIERQRADALEQAAGVAPASAIPLGLMRALRGGVLALAAFAFVSGICLRFDLRAEPPPPEPSGLEEVGEDLLASLVEVEEDAIARGDKRIENLVGDLRDRVKRIVDEEKRRRVEPEPEPEEEPTPDPTPPPPAPVEVPEVGDGVISVAELEALHTQLQMELAAATDFNLDSVRRQAARGMSRDVHREFQNAVANESMPQLNMQESARNSDGGFDRVFGNSHNPMQTQDNALSTSALEGNLNDAMEAARNDIDAESMVADQKRHAVEQLFRQFLDEYVAEKGEQIADWMAGKRNRQKEVKVSAGEQLADKTDAMAESGFQDVTDDPYDRREDDGEAGMPGMPVDEIPEGAEVTTLEGEPPGNGSASGMPGADGMQGTTLGAQGAGRGAPGDEAGAKAREVRALPGAELERILGRVTDDQLPPEKRREVLEEIATHKIRGGFANDFDETQSNYFEEADRLLLEESEDLPPLFRDYAHSYFQAILEM